MSVPSTRTEPLSGGMMPAAAFRSVLLPHPEGPMMMVLCPLGKVTEMSLRISYPSELSRTFLSSTADSISATYT